MGRADESIGGKLWGFIGITMVCLVVSALVAVAAFFITSGPHIDSSAVVKYTFFSSFACLMLLQIFAPKLLANVVAGVGHLFSGISNGW